MAKQAIKKGTMTKTVTTLDRRAMLKAFKEINGLEKAVEKEQQLLIMPVAFV